MRTLLATIGALLLMVSTVPYCLDILRKKTKPNIVTWITWTLLTGIAAAATFAAHEPKSAFLTLGSAISTFLVVVLGLRHGFAKLSLFDVVCQIGAIVGLILWFIFNSPAIAIIAAVSIDFIGLLPTVRHSWLRPKEETWQTFAWSVLAISLTLVSLTSFTVAGLLYPAYLFLADGLLVVVIVTRRRKLRLNPYRQAQRRGA